MSRSKKTGLWAGFAMMVLAPLCLMSETGATIAGAASAGPPYLLVLGASSSVGVQPTMMHPDGQRTSDGYANILSTLEERRWPGLTLVQLGCPGASTSTVLRGRQRCTYGDGTQLAEAVRFLHTHPTTVLVTVDLGFNDLLPCLRGRAVDGSCVDSQLAVIHTQLLSIVSALRTASLPGAAIIGVGHYDPFLGSYIDGAAGQNFALASLTVFQRLNQVLRATYADAGIPIADVAHAFAMGDSQHNVGTAPQDPANVARVCTLTWMCAQPPYGPNVHPNDAGYSAIADALVRAIDTALGPPPSG